jgi:ATP-dependent Clp protease ATP-binding subunit ClpA
MRLANEEARRLNHEYVGTEHILLGLIKEGAGGAANVLKHLDIGLGDVRSEIEKIIPCGLEVVTTSDLPQTPAAKKVIVLALEEARALTHNYVGTEHLLLGLLREQEGVAAQVLMNRGLKLEDVRDEIENLLGPITIRENLNKAFMYLPEEVIQLLQILREMNDRLEKLRGEKEKAMGEQNFQRAALLRDKEVKIKEWLLETVKRMQAFIREVEGESQ